MLYLNLISIFYSFKLFKYHNFITESFSEYLNLANDRRDVL